MVHSWAFSFCIKYRERLDSRLALSTRSHRILKVRNYNKAQNRANVDYILRKGI